MAEPNALLKQRPRSAPMELLHKRSTDKAMEAQRKNRIETDRLHRFETTIDRRKIMCGVVWQYEKEQVRDAMNRMRMTSGYCERVRAPKEGGSDPYEKSPYALNRLSEKKLSRWRVQEKTLRRTTLHPDNLRQLQPPWERESLDKKTETLVNVLRLFGYKEREVEEMIAALQQPKLTEKPLGKGVPEPLNNVSRTTVHGTKERVDVFESVRPIADKSVSVTKWANQIVNDYINGVGHSVPCASSEVDQRVVVHEEINNLGTEPRVLSKRRNTANVVHPPGKPQSVRPHTTIGSRRRWGFLSDARPMTAMMMSTSKQRDIAHGAGGKQSAVSKYINKLDVPEFSEMPNVEDRELKQSPTGYSNTSQESPSVTLGDEVPIRDSSSSQHSWHQSLGAASTSSPVIDEPPLGAVSDTRNQPIVPLIRINSEDIETHQLAPTRYPKLPGSEKRRDSETEVLSSLPVSATIPQWRRQLLTESPPGLHTAAITPTQPVFTTRSQRQKDLDQMVEAHENDLKKSIRKAHLRKLQCRIKVYVALTRLAKVAPAIKEDEVLETAASRPQSPRTSLIRDFEDAQRRESQGEI